MKKLISICIILLILTLGINLYAMEDFDPRTPKLVIEELKTLPTVNAGETLNLTLNIQNTSKYTASSVRITPSFDNTPLVYERPIVVNLEKSIKSKKDATVDFSFKISETAKLGIYTIPFKLQYDNIYDQTFTTEQNIYFKVAKENSTALITVSNIKTSVENITPSSQFTLTFNVNNLGDLDAKNMKVILTGLNKDEFIAVDSEDTKFIGTLSGNNSQAVSFNLNASKDITSGTHSLSLEITYDNSDNETISQTKAIYISNVSGNDKDDEPISTEGGTPKVMISSYSTNPSLIKAGDTIKFTFTFMNTNNSKTMKNMKLTVDSTEGAFMIARGSNTFYVESMRPKASISKSVELNVKQDLTSKSYPINISFDYEDNKGNNYTSREIINLPVVEYSKFVINSVYVGEAYVGGNTSLSFDYINMGKATVSNLTASVEGDYESVQPINYIGNLNAGTSDYYDIEVKPTKEGQNIGTLVLSFEDSSGKIIEERKSFEGFGMEQFVPDNPDEPTYDIPMEEPSETFHLNPWTIVGIGLATFVVSFIITKIIATKIFRKKLEDEI